MWDMQHTLLSDSINFSLLLLLKESLVVIFPGRLPERSFSCVCVCWLDHGVLRKIKGKITRVVIYWKLWSRHGNLHTHHTHTHTCLQMNTLKHLKISSDNQVPTDTSLGGKSVVDIKYPAQWHYPAYLFHSIIHRHQVTHFMTFCASVCVCVWEW